MAGVSFPQEFLWGCATASYQIEGGVGEDGRGETIWDRFSHTPGRIQGGDTGDVACDHYHRWREDLGHMRELGLRAYRFSVAWARLYPAGGGALNGKGLDFYERLVDALLAAGIEPLLTVYHWDLPQALQERGGWTNRDTPSYFTDYAVTLFERLADRVKHWITHNEPWVAAFAGHEQGVHAPGLRDRRAALQAAHHLLLSHALAVRAFRELDSPGGRIGISLNLHPVHPASESAEDLEAARRADGVLNRWFLDPVFRGAYPQDVMEEYRSLGEAPQVREGDMQALAAAAPDFLGVNYYFPWTVSAPERQGELYRQLPPWGRTTEMGWPVQPRGLEELLVRLHRDYSAPQLYVTENGIACPDGTLSEDGRVVDRDRIEYLRDHLLAAARALRAGVRLGGYFVWSLMDNFEWAHGYSKRFGLLRVDFRTQERTWKQSAFWYRELIARGGLSQEEEAAGGG